MGCTKNPSKICSKCVFKVAAVICLSVPIPTISFAAFASKFSLTAGEQYTDNVFLSKNKEHDFITFITPTFTFLYAPQGEPIPTLNLNVSPSLQAFARHSELNNFADNISIDGGFTQRFSPVFSIHLSNRLAKTGEARTLGEFGGQFGRDKFVDTPTSQPATGTTRSGSTSENLKDFVLRGDQFINNFSARGNYLYSPTASMVGEYTNSYVNFIDAGGREIFHTVGLRGVYNWREQHNLHAGYSVKIGRSRNGDSNVIHDFDVGDDFFSNLQVRFSPTLTLAASSGISVNTGSSGPHIANNTNLTLSKIWQTASLSAGLRKGLTPSFGVSGISDTTSMLSNLNIRPTERISVNSGVDFSLFDTEDVDFKTFQANIGMQYFITSWLSSNLGYSFRWVDRGRAASDVTLLDRGIVRGNLVFLSLTLNFDIWPNTGLARSITEPSSIPMIRTPFPSTPSATVAP